LALPLHWSFHSCFLEDSFWTISKSHQNFLFLDSQYMLKQQTWRDKPVYFNKGMLYMQHFYHKTIQMTWLDRLSVTLSFTINSMIILITKTLSSIDIFNLVLSFHNTALYTPPDLSHILYNLTVCICTSLTYRTFGQPKSLIHV